jgi:ABC-type enterochelin transport system permease subunit
MNTDDLMVVVLVVFALLFFNISNCYVQKTMPPKDFIIIQSTITPPNAFYTEQKLLKFIK